MDGTLKNSIGDRLEQLQWTDSWETWLADQCAYFLSFGARSVYNGMGWKKNITLWRV